MPRTKKSQSNLSPGSATAQKGRLVDRVAKRLQERGEPVVARAANRAVVLVHWQEIEETAEGGFSLRALWETLKEEGIVDFAYPTFVRHISAIRARAAPGRSRALLPACNAKPEPPVPTKSSGQAGSRKPTAVELTVAKTKAGMAGFTFNPIPNEEELY
ncbi:TraK family protein [Variovorax sp. SRS16]|uniref:TraK family protein n=1 Tax=Variovorax sp. SRS16 TaxID=282217 RepID=UPI0013A57243|nr:TraK family protein [Variovorax sp. SRS16]